MVVGILIFSTAFAGFALLIGRHILIRFQSKLIQESRVKFSATKNKTAIENAIHQIKYPNEIVRKAFYYISSDAIFNLGQFLSSNDTESLKTHMMEILLSAECTSNCRYKEHKQAFRDLKKSLSFLQKLTDYHLSFDSYLKFQIKSVKLLYKKYGCNLQ